MRQKKSLIDRKDQTAAKAACDRYVFSEIHHAEVGKNLNETIIPESSTHVIIEIRKCIQRKEYGDAAKLISAYTQLAVGKMRWYQSLIRVSSKYRNSSRFEVKSISFLFQYALICLLYDPVIQGSGLLDMFLEGVIMCRNVEEKEQFLKEITHFPKTIHSTRRCFGKLWKEKEDKKESNVSPMNVEKLCAALSRQTNEDVDDDDADYDENNSEWESYSESSSSSAEEVETTEVENVIDMNETLDKLKDELFI